MNYIHTRKAELLGNTPLGSPTHCKKQPPAPDTQPVLVPASLRSHCSSEFGVKHSLASLPCSLHLSGLLACGWLDLARFASCVHRAGHSSLFLSHLSAVAAVPVPVPHLECPEETLPHSPPHCWQEGGVGLLSRWFELRVLGSCCLSSPVFTHP